MVRGRRHGHRRGPQGGAGARGGRGACRGRPGVVEHAWCARRRRRPRPAGPHAPLRRCLRVIPTADDARQRGQPAGVRPVQAAPGERAWGEGWPGAPSACVLPSCAAAAPNARRTAPHHPAAAHNPFGPPRASAAPQVKCGVDQVCNASKDAVVGIITERGGCWVLCAGCWFVTPGWWGVVHRPSSLPLAIVSCLRGQGAAASTGHGQSSPKLPAASIPTRRRPAASSRSTLPYPPTPPLTRRLPEQGGGQGQAVQQHQGQRHHDALRGPAHRHAAAQVGCNTGWGRAAP